MENFGLTLIKHATSYSKYLCTGDALQTSKLVFQSGMVNFCTPDFRVEADLDSYIPNEEYFNQQWYLHNTGQYTNDDNQGVVDADIDAPEAWDITKGSSNVVTAVIDTGVTSNHADLPNSRQIRLFGSNFAYPYDGNSRSDSDPVFNGNSARFTDNHGNACAGIIAATQDNNQGITGIAPLTKIMPIKIFFQRSTTSTFADAIDFAVNNGASIINNSWSFRTTDSNFSPVIISAIQNAIDSSVLILFSAGNNANHNGNVAGYTRFPGNTNIADVITVGASDRNNNQANYSPNSSYLEIVAPSSTGTDGSDVWTIDIPGLNQGDNSVFDYRNNFIENLPSSGVNYDAYTGRFGGTSAATPMVAGVAALMLSVNPCLTPAQVRNILTSTTDQIGGFDYNYDPSAPGKSIELGYGKVNAYKAVKKAKDMYSPTFDLHIADGIEDLGVEPNVITPDMWRSTDIWIRNNNDGGLDHQNPEYRSDGSPNFINVRIKNRSCVEMTANEYLKMYWAKASTALNYPENWNGTMFNNQNFPLGAELQITEIPILAGQEEVVVKIPWVVPNPENYAMGAGAEDRWHFCLLAMIDSVNDPLVSPVTANPNFMVRNNNNIAWRNLSVVDLREEGERSADVMVANPSETARVFYLEMYKEINEVGKPIYEEAEVVLTMDDVLLNAWKRGGENAAYIQDQQLDYEKLVDGDHVLLENIMFGPLERGMLKLDFSFLIKELTDKETYKYHVVQKDAFTHEVIGGETYLIKKSQRPDFNADAGMDREEPFNENIKLSAAGIGEDALYRWYDENNDLLSENIDLDITVNETQIYRLEVEALADGYKDYDTVTVSVRPSSIIHVSPNPASSQITIEYELNQVESASLIISDIYGAAGTYQDYSIASNSLSKIINLSNFTSGFYTITLVCDGIAIDSKTFIKY